MNDWTTKDLGNGNFQIIPIGGTDAKPLTAASPNAGQKAKDNLNDRFRRERYQPKQLSPENVDRMQKLFGTKFE